MLDLADASSGRGSLSHPSGRSPEVRGTQQVIEDHLRLSIHGTVEEDLDRNYTEDVVLLTGRGRFSGHDGLRVLAETLNEELPDARFEYRLLLVDGDYGFLEWSAFSRRARVTDGADSYVVRNGRIVAQTIHYTVEPLPPRDVRDGREGEQ